THPYDSTDTTTIPSLSGSTDIVSAELAEEVAARATIAGLEIIETRISSLAYAPEIAQSMLQRQQAAAIVDARETIVDGAVSMVETALSQLDERDIVDLDPERRATMVSNLLVVLCSDNNAQPVINTGSLYT
ncbi:MAG: SPFH domain-containing protein, partial [Corynebacterium matruchotii]